MVRHTPVSVVPQSGLGGPPVLSANVWTLAAVGDLLAWINSRGSLMVRHTPVSAVPVLVVPPSGLDT